jgi:hypothetical protein
MLWAVGARQSSRKSIDRIVFADQDQFVGPARFRPEAIADLKAWNRSRMDGRAAPLPGIRMEGDGRSASWR